MRGARFFSIAVLACWLAMAWESREAAGETWTLELKRLPTRGNFSPADYVYRTTTPQTFYMAFQDKSDEKSPEAVAQIQMPGQNEHERAFKRIVKKEPKYASKHPFRAVVKLGSQEFAFALDTAPPKTDEKNPQTKDGKAKEEAKPGAAPGLLETLGRALAGGGATRTAGRGKAIAYSRLYFDLNGNGDLTDERVIEAESTPEMVQAGVDFAYRQFPRVDLTIDVGGAKVDYAFTLTAQSNAMNDQMSYVFVSLNAAAYREGEITLEGKKRRVALIDYNSNGRFDDEIKLRDDVQGAGGVLYPSFGDVLILDPESNRPAFVNPNDVLSGGNRHYVSKLLNIDGHYYDVKVTPAGDKLTLTPATPSLGYVTNPNDGFSALLYGEKGFVKVSGGKSAPTPLPEGDWKLLSYTIDLTNLPESKPRPGEKKEKAGQKETEKPKSSPLLSALTRALAGATGPAMGMLDPGQARLNRVSAQATTNCKPVQVRKGQTVALPFGPPYKPVVRVQGTMGAGQVRLGLDLVGAGGEQCTDMMVRGGRPSNPQFTITNPKGEIVQRGQFEYG
jgi:hypothetical protein